jgi:hypothetical protein
MPTRAIMPKAMMHIVRIALTLFDFIALKEILKFSPKTPSFISVPYCQRFRRENDKSTNYSKIKDKSKKIKEMMEAGFRLQVQDFNQFISENSYGKICVTNIFVLNLGIA